MLLTWALKKFLCYSLPSICSWNCPKRWPWYICAGLYCYKNKMHEIKARIRLLRNSERKKGQEISFQILITFLYCSSKGHYRNTFRNAICAMLSLLSVRKPPLESIILLATFLTCSINYLQLFLTVWFLHSSSVHLHGRKIIRKVIIMLLGLNTIPLAQSLSPWTPSLPAPIEEICFNI